MPVLMSVDGVMVVGKEGVKDVFLPFSTLTMTTHQDSPTLALIASSNARLLSQGAEARVYLVNMPVATVTTPAGPSAAAPPADELILKHRFPKLYRHAALSAALTAQRTALEARALVRCAREGVVVPQLRLVDEKQGIIAMEVVDGRSIRQWLGGGAEGEQEEEEIDTDEEQSESEQDEVLEPEDQRESSSSSRSNQCIHSHAYTQFDSWLS